MNQNNPVLPDLIEIAISLGASNARMIPSGEIQVKDDLALKCLEPRCENYGLSYSCPPHVGGPAQFRQLICSHPRALVLRLVVPSSMLLSWERCEIGKYLHELVANVELEAVHLGFKNSAGFAGGSCKELFCQDHLACQRLERQGVCRHPRQARPSMSGYGVDVFQLMKTCGWPTNLKTNQRGSSLDSLSWVAGLIMIG